MQSLKSPKAGEVVKCWYPESEHIFTPGSKFRPVIVLGTDESRGGMELFVAYGTSQNVANRRRGDFVVYPAELGLDKPTKFNLGKALWLPLAPEYFTENGEMVVIGALPREALRRCRDAAKEVGLS